MQSTVTKSNVVVFGFFGYHWAYCFES